MIVNVYLDLYVGDLVCCPNENFLPNLYTKREIDEFYKILKRDEEYLGEVYIDDEEWFFFRIEKINKQSVVLKHLGVFNTASGELNKPFKPYPKTTRKYVGDKIPYVELVDSKTLVDMGVLSQSIDFILNKE